VTEQRIITYTEMVSEEIAEQKQIPVTTYVAREVDIPVPGAAIAR